jgi:hypothetical protein
MQLQLIVADMVVYIGNENLVTIRITKQEKETDPKEINTKRRAGKHVSP